MTQKNAEGQPFKLKKFPLLPRAKEADKSHYGHVLVIAGSRGMQGAALLAARAALISGSGLVTLTTTESLGRRPHVPPEIMKLSAPETPAGTIAFSAAQPLLRFIARRRINSVLIGPGLSQNRSTVSLVRKLVASVPATMVLDADGLNSFQKKSELLRRRHAPLVVTPHRREFERLFGEAWPEKREMRVSLAKKLSKTYDVLLVLKGHETLVVEGERWYLNRTGNPAMAKGGSGDVLSGVIAAFIAQGLSSFEAACWAVYFHGLAGDLAVTKTGELSLAASDLIDYLPKAFKQAAHQD